MILFVNNIGKKSSFGYVSQNITKHLDRKEYLIINYNEDFYMYKKNQFILSFIYDVMFLIRLKIMIKKNKPNSVIFTDSSKIISNLSWLFLSKINKYVIFHDDFYLYWSTRFKKYKRQIQIKALFSFDKIFCVSKKSLDSLLKLNIEPQKLVLIKLGIDSKIYFPPKQKRELRLNKYIISIGSNIPRKNFEKVLETFFLLKSKYPQLKLVKIGVQSDIKSDFNRYLQQKIKKLNIKEDILFLGFVDKNELHYHIGNAELLLFPSLEEGFGLPIIEALACGIPVITSNNSPMSTLVPYSELLVNPYNEQDIFEKCISVLSNDIYRDKLVKQGFEFSKQFSWKNTTKTINKHLLD